MTHWRQKPRARTEKRSLSKILAVREASRALAISAVVCELNRIGGKGAIVHARIAERTGFPIEFIKWKYPSVESLLYLADLHITPIPLHYATSPNED
jgi:hypothetical protein